jgi:hypothetical protein
VLHLHPLLVFPSSIQQHHVWKLPFSLSWFLHVLLQLNTKDILFICGGAFVNLDRLVAERTSTASLGFGNPVGLPSTLFVALTSTLDQQR